MARTYKIRTLAIPDEVYTGLEARKKAEGYLGSLTSFAAGILGKYSHGRLADEHILRSKIEAEIYASLNQAGGGRTKIVGLTENQNASEKKHRRAS